ncbi:peptide deformylase [Olivibacter sp. SDN3]|uniref:peptide deformylase n=1 Tax=Olivibacter sp. SDN3 TaxID=2764720 RepID=UPI00165151E0|nr:peptide deformylase [Olivibacter sp. SDN3]QNL50223.1 peptide deformylase [Olivibacter sp. SDN3]
MKLPILAYGHRILKQKCESIDRKYPNLEQIIRDMWETVQNANGCGLAASQIGQAIRLFVVDSKTTYENLEEVGRQTFFDENDKGIRETFINANVIERSCGFWEDDEGCLSIPNLSQKVKRNWTVTIEYYNQDFEKQTQTFSGTTARMIQHEYDHTEGILYVDYLKPLTKQLVAPKLKKIAKGQIKASYPMKFI